MRICTSPPGEGQVVLGKTIPDLLDEACEKNPNPRFLNQRVDGEWVSYSHHAFREEAEAQAAGWVQLGMQPGQRVALFMHSNADFVRVDMGCILARLVDVPIYLTYAPELIAYTLQHAEARALVVADEALLERLLPILDDLTTLDYLVVARPPGHWESLKSQLPAFLTPLTLDELIEQGRKRLENEPDLVTRLKQAIQPEDLLTILYTSGTTGLPKGVMLTHQNLTFNVISAFSVFEEHFLPGQEVTLSFLPLTHIFARMMQYGYMYRGAAVYFTEPKRLVEDAQAIRPTAFITVPRLVERIYERILERAQTLKGVKGALLRQAVAFAQEYDWNNPPTGWKAIQHRVLDRLVYSQWRNILGGRLKYAVSGGAALRAHLVHFFAAAGIYFLEGYGLTETSPVISVNRYGRARPGTAGQPIPGVEVAIAEDGEILTRGPHVMKGYYKNPRATREVIDEEGWFHTGDIGHLDEDCYLRITDRKKHLFKLSTGKYVAPQPLEDLLRRSPLVDQAMVVGEGRKFTAALLFVNEEAVRLAARRLGLRADRPLLDLLREKAIQEQFREAVAQINAAQPRWMRIRRVALIPHTLTMEQALLTPTLKVRRARVCDAYSHVIVALYQTPPGTGDWVILDVEK